MSVGNRRQAHGGVAPRPTERILAKMRRVPGGIPGLTEPVVCCCERLDYRIDHGTGLFRPVWRLRDLRIPCFHTPPLVAQQQNLGAAPYQSHALLGETRRRRFRRIALPLHGYSARRIPRPSHFSLRRSLQAVVGTDSNGSESMIRAMGSQRRSIIDALSRIAQNGYHRLALQLHWSPA